MGKMARSLSRKIKTAHSLQSIVRTLKILSATNIIPAKKAVTALEQYYQTIEFGLAACLEQAPEIPLALDSLKQEGNKIGVIVFGSDQGMVGYFNEQIAEYGYTSLQKRPGKKIFLPVGGRVDTRLRQFSDVDVANAINAPATLKSVTAVIGKIIFAIENEKDLAQLWVCYHRPIQGARFEPTSLQILPLDKEVLSRLAVRKWPANVIPQIIDGIPVAFEGLLREHLYVSLYKACVESVTSENNCRLVSMQVAEKNIGDRINALQKMYNRERQNTIDEELFDVISDYITII